MAEYTPGRAAASAGASRDARTATVLARWPVIAEPWAQVVERRRTGAVGDAAPARPAPPGPAAPEAPITPLQAINRALGLPDDDGLDAVQQRRATGNPGTAAPHRSVG
jgi:hypothetical protein